MTCQPRPKTHTPLPLEERADQPQLNFKKQLPGSTEKKAVARKRNSQKYDANPKCRVDGCKKHSMSKRGLGLCDTHYQRLYTTGSIQSETPISFARHGINHARWKGGEIINERGRVLVFSPNHPFPSSCKKYVYRYRLVMEKHLGRFLDPKEIVHHKNGIKDDDRIENLEVMTNQEHARFHSLNTRKRNHKGQLTNN